MVNSKTQHFMADCVRASIRSERVDHRPMYTAPDLGIDVIVDASRRTITESELGGQTTSSQWQSYVN